MQSTPMRVALLTSAALAASLAIGCAQTSGKSASSDTGASMSTASTGSATQAPMQSPPATVASDRTLPIRSTTADSGTGMARDGSSTAAPMPAGEPAPRADRH